MNFLGAGSGARLALTRSMRSMPALDREWLLSITYPHLVDSCRRRALGEVRTIINEVAGVECFSGGAAQPPACGRAPATPGATAGPGAAAPAAVTAAPGAAEADDCCRNQ